VIWGNSGLKNASCSKVLMGILEERGLGGQEKSRRVDNGRLPGNRSHHGTGIRNASEQFPVGSRK